MLGAEAARSSATAAGSTFDLLNTIEAVAAEGNPAAVVVPVAAAGAAAASAAFAAESPAACAAGHRRDRAMALDTGADGSPAPHSALSARPARPVVRWKAMRYSAVVVCPLHWY
jgi:hypothetical protein